MSRILDGKRDMDTIKRLRSEIGRLQEQMETLRLEYLNASRDAMMFAGKLEAAEAERDRLWALLAELEGTASSVASAVARGGGILFAINQMGAAILSARAALQKEPQP